VHASHHASTDIQPITKAANLLYLWGARIYTKWYWPYYPLSTLSLLHMVDVMHVVIDTPELGKAEASSARPSVRIHWMAVAARRAKTTA